jgi:hypothetical protein
MTVLTLQSEASLRQATLVSVRPHLPKAVTLLVGVSGGDLATLNNLPYIVSILKSCSI